MLDTINGCKEYGINYVGASSNIDAAIKPLVLAKENCKVALLNACEDESSIATKDSAGAAPIDIIRLYEQIKSLKQEVDYVICISHGGVEHFRIHLLKEKKFRFIASAGADLIVNHQQHCFSEYEVYNGVPIFFALGNFCFGNVKKRNVPWNYN